MTYIEAPGHVTCVGTAAWVACIHLPGDYRVVVQVAGPDNAGAALELGRQTVNANLTKLLAMAPPTARRAYCLALGGGFDQ